MLVSEWIGGGCGPWRETAGQLVLSVWRTKFMQTRICRHADQQAVELESAALHGGRASVWYFGDCGDRRGMPVGMHAPPSRSPWRSVDGPIHRLDITSMYPSLLMDRYYPTRLIGWKEGIDPDHLAALCESRGVLATVLADVSHPEYPLKTPHRVVHRWPGEGCRSRKVRTEHAATVLYPVGQCTLTLAGPELLRLHSEGSILKVHRAAIYDLGRPFEPLMRWLLEQRTAAKERGHSFLANLYKTWANAFGGKFAQGGTRWVPRPEITPPIRWGYWTDLDADTGTREFFRSFSGLVSQRTIGPPGAQLLAAVFGYLTSYGRLLMRDVRAGFPPRSILSQDTDGIWTTADPLTTVGMPHTQTPSAPGTLRLVSSHAYSRWYTPKHYYTDGVWTLAGISQGFGVARGDEVEWRSMLNDARGVPSSPPSLITETVQRARLDRIGPSEFIDSTGWSVPPCIRGGRVQAAEIQGTGMFGVPL